MINSIVFLFFVELYTKNREIVANWERRLLLPLHYKIIVIMAEYKLKSSKIEEKVVGTYKKIENEVVESFEAMCDGVEEGYKNIENAVVDSYKKIEKKFVDTFLEEK